MTAADSLMAPRDELPVGAATDDRRRGRLAPVSGREAALAFIVLTLLAALTFGPYAVDGGFTFDDWANAAGSLYAGSFGGMVDYFAELTMYRPGLVIYVPITYELFGNHMGFHLAWAAGIGVFVSWCLYGVLRTVRLPSLHAGAIAALVLLFPWADSTRFWSTASQVTLGVALALAGLWLALIALRRRSLPLHCASLALYATSILTYEIALLMVPAYGLVYVSAVGWRAARARWAADVVVGAAGAIWVWSQTKRESGGLSEKLDHAWDIVVSGGTLLGRAGLPLGPQHTTLVLLALALTAMIGSAYWYRERGRRLPHGTSMTPWLLLGAAGLSIAGLGWAIFVPAHPYYTPSVFGVTNRVNGLAAVGLVMVVYAALGIIGALVARLTARPAFAATAVTLALAGALGLAYKGVLERHSDIWIAAYNQQMGGLGALQAALPNLPDGTTVFISGHPAYLTLGVPIFSSSWDVNGAIKLYYDNPTLSAQPVLHGSTIECERAGVKLAGPGFPNGAVPYGTVRLFDVASGRVADPTSRRACQRVAPAFAPGPLYLSFDY